jgi:hypothetical protein
MSLDIDARAIRKLDLATFTGDTWADDPTLAEPPAAVPRLVANGQPIRWCVYGMTSDKLSAEQEVDTTTSISTCLIKLSRTRASGGAPLVRACVAVSGTVLAHDITEEDVSEGDVFVIGIPAITVGTAPFIWIVPTSGFSTVLPTES